MVTYIVLETSTNNTVSLLLRELQDAQRDQAKSLETLQVTSSSVSSRLETLETNWDHLIKPDLIISVVILVLASMISVLVFQTRSLLKSNARELKKRDESRAPQVTQFIQESQSAHTPQGVTSLDLQSLEENLKESFKESLKESLKESFKEREAPCRELSQLQNTIQNTIQNMVQELKQELYTIKSTPQASHHSESPAVTAELKRELERERRAQREIQSDHQAELGALREKHQEALAELKTSHQATLEAREAELNASHQDELKRLAKEQITREEELKRQLGSHQALYTDDLEHLEAMITLVSETPELMTRLQILEGLSKPELLKVLTIKLSNEAYIRKLFDFYTDQCFARERPCEPKEEALINWAIKLRNLASSSDEWTRSVVELGVMTSDHEVTSDLNSGKIQEVYLRGVAQDHRMPSAVRVKP